MTPNPAAVEAIAALADLASRISDRDLKQRALDALGRAQRLLAMGADHAKG